MAQEVNAMIGDDSPANSRFLNFSSFPRLSPAILAMGKKCVAETGAILFNFGDKIDCLRYIHSGLVRGSRILEDGKELFAVLLGRNNIFPDIFYYSGLKSQSQMRALRPATMTVFDAATLEKLFASPEFMKFITASIAIKAINTANRLVAMLSENRKDKLLYLLRELAFYEGEKTRAGRSIKFSHEELASILGMHRVTVSKILAELARDGLIQSHRNNILLLNAAWE